MNRRSCFFKQKRLVTLCFFVQSNKYMSPMLTLKSMKTFRFDKKSFLSIFYIKEKLLILIENYKVRNFNDLNLRTF